jgi:hypothetical protein
VQIVLMSLMFVLVLFPFLRRYKVALSPEAA